jgi:hypothetical protein
VNFLKIKKSKENIVQEKLMFKPKDIEEYMQGLPERLPVVSLVTLHPRRRRAEEKRLAAIEKRKHRKRYTRKPGTVSPKKKAATLRRRLEKKWAEEPFWCVAWGAYGKHSIDREKWDAYLQPYWAQYRAKDLKVVRYKRDPLGQYYGTKVNPFTVYSLKLMHSKNGLLYDGHNQLLYDLSIPKEPVSSSFG